MKTENNNSMKPFFSMILTSGVPRLALSAGLTASLVTTLVGLSIPLLTREMVDGFSANSINLALSGILALVFIVQAVCDGFSTYFLSYAGQKVVASLRERMWFKLLRLPVRYFDEKTSGETVSRVVNDTGIVESLISDHFPQFVSGIITIVGSVVILLIMDWKMTLLMLISVPITTFIMIPLGMKMQRISKTMQDETASFTGHVQQTLSEIRLMKASNAEHTEKMKGLSGISKLFQYGLKEARIFALVSPFMHLVIMIVIVAIIGYGGIRVSEGTMSAGSLIAFLLYLFQIIFPITSFTMFFTQLQKAKGATERIIEIMHSEEEEGQEGLEMDISNLPIHVENVTFTYAGGEPVLRGVSFDVDPGQMIAFVGPSGGGKTTMFGLLERFYEPDSGAINIGETPISKLSMKSWRSQIGYVSQDSPMMSGTIRENLCYGLDHADSIDDQELWKVAEMAYADTFIKQFPEQLDTEVGERGVKLSGG